MAELSFGTKSVNLDAIEDRQVRRAIIEYHEQVTQAIERQQLEIEALLEVLVDHHFTSLGEIKRRIQRLKLRTGSGDRLHEAVTAAMAQPAPGAGRGA